MSIITTSCQCPLAGWCERHKVNKTEQWHLLCQRREDYFQSWEEGRGPGQKKNQPARQRTPKVNHWDSLHRYAVEHYDDWNEAAAKAFYGEWEKTIPNKSCKCRQKWKKLGIVFDFSSPRAFFESAWAGHDKVSEMIEKPRFTLEECVAIWGFPEQV